MTPPEKGEAVPPATERAEQILQQTGQRLGLLAQRVRQQWQQARQAVRQEAVRMDVPTPARTSQPSGENGAPSTPTRQATTERAEELVDRLGQRLGQWATVNGRYTKRAVARLREDVEDLWVEAREIRAGWTGKRERAQRT